MRITFIRKAELFVHLYKITVSYTYTYLFYTYIHMWRNTHLLCLLLTRSIWI